jgi:D-amino-acid dehydrogenase
MLGGGVAPIEAERIVLAGGAWSASLARRLGHAPLLESERGYHLMLEGADPAPPYPYMLAEAAAVATPMAAGLRVAGLLEIGGLEAGPSAAPVRLLEKTARTLYPTLRWEAARSWLGHRPGPPDSLPYIGESPRAPGVFFAFGAHHVGVTSGPKTGRLIADLVLGKENGRRPNLDLSPYRIDRFD